MELIGTFVCLGLYFQVTWWCENVLNLVFPAVFWSFMQMCFKTVGCDQLFALPVFSFIWIRRSVSTVHLLRGTGRKSLHAWRSNPLWNHHSFCSGSADPHISLWHTSCFVRRFLVVSICFYVTSISWLTFIFLNPTLFCWAVSFTSKPFFVWNHRSSYHHYFQILYFSCFWILPCLFEIILTGLVVPLVFCECFWAFVNFW